jgi:hypothetical protein
MRNLCHNTKIMGSCLKFMNIKKMSMMFISAILCTSMNLATPISAHAESTSTEASTETVPASYYNDSDFNAFLSEKLKAYEADPDDKTPLYELMQFIMMRGTSEKQLESILDKGYFTEYIGDFKSAGYLDKDYKLPANVKVHDSKLNMSTDEETTETTDSTISEADILSLPELDNDAQNTIMAQVCSDSEKGIYIHTPVSAESKYISGSILTQAAYNMKSVNVAFLGKEGTADYTWKMGGEILPDNETVSLSVDTER